MKKILVVAAALCFLASSALAQVGIEVQLEEDQFLIGESVPVAVKITNRSGRTLEIGESDDWLTFSLESQEVAGKIVAQTGDVPVRGGFSLPSSKRAIKRVDIAPYFAINTSGKYSLTATVRLSDLNLEVNSPPVTFYTMEGTRIWEKEVGVPARGMNAAPKVRRYLLQQANHLRGQPRLYLRITDETTMSPVKLLQIGTILSFSRPELQVDSESNLHLIYQNGPVSFGYTVYTPDGDVVTKQTWDYNGDSRPRLKPDDHGNIVVTGGFRRLTRNDIPASLDENLEPLDKPVAPTNPPVPALVPPAGGTKPSKK